MQVGSLVGLSACYVALLFGVAWLGDRAAAGPRRLLDRPAVSGTIYCLTLAVYNTGWSFYGSVGNAARQGWGYLPIYLAPILVLWFGRPVLRRLHAAADAQGATSIADFIAGQLGASQFVAAVVTIGSILAVLPYIALQLRAVSLSFTALSGGAVDTSTKPIAPPDDTVFWIAVAMALFTVMFGVRHSHRSRRHRGLMVAVAFDSIVKLLSFVVVASAIVLHTLRHEPSLFATDASRALLRPHLFRPLWLSNTLVAMLSFLCLPQTFHVSTVERSNPRDAVWGAWLFPVYVILLCALMLPVAAIGVSYYGGAAEGDRFMITIPMAIGRTDLAVLAFIGGLSAATGMVIVATMALATMLCNDVIMPVLLHTPISARWLRRADMSLLIVNIRRFAVIVILALAYASTRITSTYRLSETGLVSFVGVAQFGPALLGGLFWRRATGPGAIAGMLAGLAVWAGMLLTPVTYRPNSLLDPISLCTLVSLLSNVAMFIIVSLAGTSWPRVVDPAGTGQTPSEDELSELAVRFVGAEAASAAFEERKRQSWARLDALDFTRNLLAGAIGIASARVVLAASQRSTLSDQAAWAILDEASEALRLNHRLLWTVLSTIPQGICIFDQELRVSAWNGRFLELLDMPAGVVRVGMPLRQLLDYNHDRARYAKSDPRRLLAPHQLEERQWPYIYERERPDGSVLEISFDRLPEGGLVSTYIDISERHRSVLSLRSTNEQLERRVRERTLALEQARSAAEAANQSKTRFLAAAGHDLLQPLSAAKLFIATLEEQVYVSRPFQGGPPDAADRIAAAVVGAAAALRSSETMIHGLMDISAFDTGVVRTAVGDFELGSVLQPLEQEFRALLGSSLVGLDICHETVTVRSDPFLLRRIVQNYLTNALRHSGARRIGLRCRRRGGRVDIQVWDDGNGLDRTARARVFEEFHRGHGASERGMGIGLTIVHRIGQLLDHPVGVLSIPGRGTCFFVRVPLGRPVPPQAAESRRNEVARFDLNGGEPLRVLCIDDDEQVLAGMSGLLRALGIDVLHEPEAAPPDAMIVDYHLGADINGIGLIERLRVLWGSETPALLLTADRSDAIRFEANSQAIALAHKPVKPDQVKAFLAAARSPRDIVPAPGGEP